MSNIKPHIRISATAVSSTFVDDIRAIIEQGKQQAYMSVNASMIETYWHIGERIINIWKSRFPNLTWTHIYRTLRVGDDTAIRWYLGEASAQMWSVRTLDRNISTQYFERHLSAPQLQESDAVVTHIKQAELIKNPVMAEFLGFGD